jgi:hypothetical protein
VGALTGGVIVRSLIGRNEMPIAQKRLTTAVGGPRPSRRPGPVHAVPFTGPVLIGRRAWSASAPEGATVLPNGS